MPETTGLDLLTGDDAADVLQTALAPLGADLLDWRARQVEHRPGRGTQVGYEVRVRWPDGSTGMQRLAACTGRLPSGVLVLQRGEERVGVWRFPYDPALPALARATDPETVRLLLADRGLAGERDPVTVRVRAYRPGRRAVVEVRGARGALFLKVVRPETVAALHDRHRMLAAAGVRVAQSLGYTSEGLVVLQAMPGRTLRDVLCHQVRPELPPADAILDLLDTLPAALAAEPPRQSFVEQASRYAAIVGAAVPALADRATRLANAITAQARPGPRVPVHGDLYEAQLLVSGPRVTGLLDVDTAGTGDRLDDLGCLLAHLSVLSHLAPARRGVINGLGARYLAAFDRVVDPAALRYRAAAVALSLATGPHRVQEPGWPEATSRRLDVVEGWLNRARRA